MDHASWVSKLEGLTEEERCKILSKFEASIQKRGDDPIDNILTPIFEQKSTIYHSFENNPSAEKFALKVLAEGYMLASFRTEIINKGLDL